MKEQKNNLIIFTAAAEAAYTVTEQMHQGKKHLVIPVTMMVEGVHNGSHGPLFHSIEELGKYTGSWDGIPVIIGHPEINGVHVSANSPDIIDSQVIGRVYNTHVEDTKLKAEVWVDEEKLRQLSSSTLAEIKAGNILEVSVGVFTDEDKTEGTWNEETYNGIAKNHRPDHLALLPGGTGACSVKDGCGLRANKEGGTQLKKEEVFAIMKSLSLEGFAVNEIVDNSTQGFRELVDSVRQKIDAMDTNDSYHSLEEVYDDYVVYGVYYRIGGSKMYRQDYTINSGVVDLVGDPVEVRRKVEFVNVNQMQRTRSINNSKKEGQVMSKLNGCTRCAEKIDALIANTESGFVDTDREWLDTLSEAALDKVTPKVIEVEKIVEKTVEVNKLSDEDQAALAYGKKQLKERKEAMINGIKANTAAGIWDDATLNAMNEDTLEKVFNSVKKEEVNDFSLNGNTNLNVNKGQIAPMIYMEEENTKN